MWTEWLEVVADWVEIAAILAGAFFMLVSSIGIFRLPDFYLRVHAPTKAATLGLICLLVAVALNVSDRTVVTKAVLAVLFLGTTAPVGAHLLARAAYRNGVPSVGEPLVDEYAPTVLRRQVEPGREPVRARDLLD